MTRLIDALLQEALRAPNPRATGGDECLRARPATPEDTAARIQAFLTQRLRRHPDMGARDLARLAEDARRYARLLAAVGPGTLDVQPATRAWERPLEAYAIETQS